jgi:hypothetical protein
MLGASYRAGSLKTASSKLAKFMLDMVPVQKVRWDEDGSQPPDDCAFFCGNGNANHHFGICFFIHQGIGSAIQRVKFIDRMSYVIQSVGPEKVLEYKSFTHRGSWLL